MRRRRLQGMQYLQKHIPVLHCLYKKVVVCRTCGVCNYCAVDKGASNPFFVVDAFSGNLQIVEYLESIESNLCFYFTKQKEKIFYFPSYDAPPVFAIEQRAFDGEEKAFREIVEIQRNRFAKYKQITKILGKQCGSSNPPIQLPRQPIPPAVEVDSDVPTLLCLYNPGS